MPINLAELGWTPTLAQAYAAHAGPDVAAGRICREDRERYEILTEAGACHARLSGGYRFQISDRRALPVAGDWVVLSRPREDGDAIIRTLLPRCSHFSRKAVRAGGPQYGPGRTEVQVLAANIDLVFLVSGLDRDFNPRRIERYLTTAWDSGAEPVIVLNKSDLCPDPQAARSAVVAVAPGVAVHAVSARSGEGLDRLREQLVTGRTGVLLGSSGVGKSTLLNHLLGVERQAVQALRSKDQRGRHTTVVRELILLPGGGLLIDTPGLRELQPWEDAGALDGVFADITALAATCRFSNCRHDGEPGCAVQEAVAEGALSVARLANYRKLQRESAQLGLRKEQRARQDATRRRRWDRQGGKRRQGRAGRERGRRGCWREREEQFEE